MSAVVTVNAAAPSVKARLDSTNILMGKLTTLHLEVTQDKGKPGAFPIFAGQNGESGYVGVCGDSVELRTSYTRDTVDLGSGRLQINYSVPVQSFDSGFYQLPQFVYVSGNDTARSNVVSLKVVPVNVAADAKISDYADVAEPEGKSIFDALPDWLYNYWWLILILLLVIAGIFWGYKRYKEKGFILPKKPEPLPYDVAMKELSKLRGLNLWEKGEEKEYFTRLTDILRVYLDKRFGINALEMTTPQILEKLNENVAIRDKENYVRRILDTADFVKFAKVRPLAADNIAAFDNAMRFVEETKPTPEEIEAYKAAVEASRSGKKSVVNTAANKAKGKNKTAKKRIVKKGGKR